MSNGEVSTPKPGDALIPVPQAELFRVASEYSEKGRLQDAERLLGYILKAAPDQSDALHLAGVVAHRQGDQLAALTYMQRSLQGEDDKPLYWRNLGEVLRRIGRLDEALAAAQKAIALGPDDPIAIGNLAAIHAERLEFVAAESCQRQALALAPRRPSAHFGLAELLLRRGDFDEGWRQYEWRFGVSPSARANLPPGPRRMWQGRPRPPGRLLLIADQGFGDVIQFGRFIPWALERCPDAPVVCGPGMRPILAQYGATRFCDKWPDPQSYDAYAPLSGLPRLYGATADNLPTRPAWLRADAVRAASWARRLQQLGPTGARRIGLVWAGRPTHESDHRRSTHLKRLSPLLDIDGVTFISLQKGPRQGEVAQYAGRAPLANLGPELADWEDTMAVLQGLEAVVTVDTAVAHLAGAMGIATYLMLARPAEWRWMMQRPDSPWYPSVRLFRQPAAGAWSAVAHEIATTLKG